MSRTGPLSNSYASAVVLVLCALTPYLVLTTALPGMREQVTGDLGMSQRSFELTSGMANAAYAFGAVLAVQLTSKLRGRRLLVLYALLFVLATAAMAWAPTRGFFIAGHVVQGLTTGLMLIAAVPPLVISWPAKRIPTTAIVMNLGIFGATALGPVVGSDSTSLQEWRPTLWIVAGVGALALLFSLLTYEDQDPQDPDAPWDVVSLLLASTSCAAMFFAVSELMGRRATDVVVLAPLIGGVALLLALFAHQSRVDDPLIPVAKLGRTLPVAGIVVAMAAGAASTGVVQLVQSALEQRGLTPGHTAWLFWPEFGAAVLSAVVFGRVITTRWLALYAGLGLLVCAGGIAILHDVAAGAGDATVLVGIGLVGLGVGSSVAPALFLAGFSLPSPLLPRVFAIVELLRGVAAFLIGPALMQLAMTASPDPAVGSRTATWLVFGIACGGALIAFAVFLLGPQPLRRPDLEGWLAGEGPAVPSEPLLGALQDTTPLRETQGSDPTRVSSRLGVPG